MAELICDTSALLALHQIGQLDIPRSLGGIVIVPHAVWQELLTGRAGGHDVPDIPNFSWMTLRSPVARPPLPIASRLGPGERDVLWLAQETSGSVAILDDEPARRVAAGLGLKYSGTLGLLMDAKRAGLVTTLAPLLDELERHRFHLSPRVRQAVLTAVGEAP